MDATSRNIRILALARPHEIDGGPGTLVGMIRTLERGVILMQEGAHLRKQHKCPLCHRDIGPTEFDGLDSAYYDEFQISGLCRGCQDDVFVEDDNGPADC